MENKTKQRRKEKQPNDLEDMKQITLADMLDKRQDQDHEKSIAKWREYLWYNMRPRSVILGSPKTLLQLIDAVSSRTRKLIRALWIVTTRSLESLYKIDFGSNAIQA